MTVTDSIRPEDLMRYLDGELSPEERARVESELERSTELRRELTIYGAMREELRSLSVPESVREISIWDRVNRRLTRPAGWFFLIAGALALSIYGAYVFATSAVDPWEKLATGAIVIGILLLLASVIWERYREWGSDPYKDVQR